MRFGFDAFPQNTDISPPDRSYDAFDKIPGRLPRIPCKMKWQFSGRILRNNPYQKGRAHGKFLPPGKWEEKTLDR